MPGLIDPKALDAHIKSWQGPAPSKPVNFTSVPQLNQALHAGQINKQQWNQQFKVIQSKLPGAKPVKGYNLTDALHNAVHQGANIALATPRAVVSTGQQLNKQFQYLKGPAATQSQRDAVIQNQQKAQTASPKVQDLFKQAPAHSKVQAAALLAKGHKESAVQTYLNKQIALGNQQTMTGLSNAAVLASVNVAGGGLLNKALGTAKAAAGKDAAVNDLVGMARSKAIQDHFPAPAVKSPKTPLTPVTKTAGESVGKGTPAIDALKANQPLNESGGVGLPKTNDYVKQQIKMQDAARKAGSKNPVVAAKSEAKQKLIDSFAPIEDTLNKSKVKLAPENNIKYQIDRAIRGDTIGAQYIKDNGLAKVIQSASNTKELDQYLIAKHAADLEKNGIKTGRNLPADQQLVKDLGPKYEAHARAVKEYSNNLLDKATEYGLVSKEVATGLKARYPNYVPVNRIFGEGELPQIPKGVGGGKASVGSQSVVQQIKGSTRQIESPLSNLVDKTVDVVKQGERNKAAQILTGYKNLPGNPFQLRELSKDEIVGNKPVISVLDKGVPRRFETTPEIAAAAKSLNKEQLGIIGKILSVPTRVLRLGATGLNPAFALANVSKDTVSAFINTSHALRASPANPRVFMQSLIAAANHGSKQYGELVREGAGGTSFDIARNAPKQNIKAIRAERNLPSRVAYTVTRPAQLLRAAENTIGRSEEFNRAIQYFGNKQAFAKKGYDAAQTRTLAANAARSNTVNFARAGDYGRVINSTLPYLNAGVQGSRTLLRNLKDRPLQTGAKLAISTFFPVAVVTVWNTSDPKRKAAYDDIKDYEKQGNLIIVPPHPVKDPKTGKWNVIKIPMSQEIANLASVVRNGTEAAVKDGKLKVATMLGNTAGTVTSLNAQNPRQLANQLTPQAIKPGIESMTNQNLYTGNKIVPDSQKNLPAKDQTGPGTSKLAVKVGQLAKLSPRHIDNAIATGTGGLGKNIVHDKSLSNQVSERFKGAQGNSPYDLADTRFNALKGQLTALSGYKSMSSQDKAKALNRLQSAVSGALVPTPGKKLSARQRAIVNKNPDLASYLKSRR